MACARSALLVCIRLVFSEREHDIAVITVGVMHLNFPWLLWFYWGERRAQGVGQGLGDTAANAACESLCPRVRKDPSTLQQQQSCSLVSACLQMKTSLKLDISLPMLHRLIRELIASSVEEYVAFCGCYFHMGNLNSGVSSLVETGISGFGSLVKSWRVWKTKQKTVLIHSDSFRWKKIN